MPNRTGQFQNMPAKSCESKCRMIRSNLNIFVLCGQVVSVTDKIWAIRYVAQILASWPHNGEINGITNIPIRASKIGPNEKIGNPIDSSGNTPGQNYSAPNWGILKSGAHAVSLCGCEIWEAKTRLGQRKKGFPRTLPKKEALVLLLVAAPAELLSLESNPVRGREPILLCEQSSFTRK